MSACSCFSCIWLFMTLWTVICLWDSLGKNTGVGWHTLLQGIFPTQGSNLQLLQLLHCRWILYHGATKAPPFRSYFPYRKRHWTLTSSTDEWFYEYLHDLLELTPKKDVLFIIGDWNVKVGSQDTPGITGKFGLGVQNEAGQRLIEFCQENTLIRTNTLFQQHQRRLYA